MPKPCRRFAAVELQCKSIAFPLISAGVYGYPVARALSVAVENLQPLAEAKGLEVSIVLFDSEAWMLATKLYPSLTVS